MAFETLGEAAFAGMGLSFSPATGVSSGFIKLLAAGELNAQGQDRRLLIRLNGQSDGYQGFVLMNGHAGSGEWDNGGFYIGRNGWHLDVTFGLDLTIAISPTVQKITCNGSSTFAHGNNTILGFECHSFLVTNQPITRIDIGFTGGVVTGITRFIRM
jgi:hypothetical protein